MATDERGEQREYLVYYERGVGTGGFLDNFRGGAFGTGLARNIRRAYIFLAQHYEPEDEISFSDSPAVRTRHARSWATLAP
jgi:uncharacterized protein (DUF2235 family)